MKHLYLIALGTLMFFALSTVSGAQTVNGSIARGTVSRGSSAAGSVVIDIPGGLHVNSSRPNSQYAIATTVSVSGAGVKTSRVRYPAGRNRKFAFSENAINVYEGRTSFPFTVTVPTGFKGDTVRVRAVVKYQACTNEVCYPPKTKEIMLTAKVR